MYSTEIINNNLQIEYNRKKELVLDKTNLSEDQVRIIEQHFLNVVVNQKNFSKPSGKQSFDPMVA